MGDAGEALNLLAHLMALLVVPHLDHSLRNDRKLDNLNVEQYDTVGPL